MLFCDPLSLEPGEKMEYPKSHSNKNTTLVHMILATLNFILLVIITVSFNYLVIDFLF